VTVQLNEVGDTVKTSTVTDRTRARAFDRRKDVEIRTEIVRDTVYVEKRDSSLQVTAYGLQEDGTDERSKSRAKLAWAMPCKEEEKRSLTPTISSKLSAVSKIMKWIFWILIGLIGLIITMKVCSLRR
jgi:hypothetical protein